MPRCCKSKSSGTKFCKQDLLGRTIKTIFSIIPMTNGSIQIRSLTNGGNQCMSTYPDYSIAIENRFGLGEYLLDRSIVTVLCKLLCLLYNRWKCNTKAFRTRSSSCLVYHLD
ncbi:hypothetical protein UXU46_08485 [Campylobacter jejuni]